MMYAVVENDKCKNFNVLKTYALTTAYHIYQLFEENTACGEVQSVLHVHQRPVLTF
jgi:hypothetical protein